MRFLRLSFLAILLACTIFCQAPLSSGGYLGISVRNLSPDETKSFGAENTRGALITDITDGSPADRAGLKPGDILIRFNGHGITDSRDLTQFVSSTAPGHRVSIQYLRGGKMLTSSITPGQRPSLEQQELPPPFGAFPTDIPAPLLVWRNTLLGTECEPLTPQLAGYFGVQSGVLVRFVVQGSIANASGLHAGDVLVSAGDRPVMKPRDVTGALQDSARAGAKVLHITVIRDHKKVQLEIPVSD